MAVLDGRMALVTGGASGIGAATAKRMMEMGAFVVITDIDEGRGQATADEMGVDCTFVSHDVTSEASWRRVIAIAQQAMGGLNVLVNCAGVFQRGDVASTELEDFRAVMAVNTEGVFIGCRESLAVMGEEGGAIVNVASVASARGAWGAAAYAASKSAVVSLTRSTALYCAHNSIPVRCNAVLPGVTDTPMAEAAMQSGADVEAVRMSMQRMQPMGRMGTADEVAAAICFLVSDDAQFITGAGIPVDGGLLAG